ncbi:MAG: ASKHA domain-containing protein [Alphaproteobacteria bacterium]
MSEPRHDGEARACEVGRTVFDLADDLRVAVPTSCGRSGQCHECIVEITKGMAALSARSEAESFLRGDFRLACQACITRDDIDIEFSPLRRAPRIVADSLDEDELPSLDSTVTRSGDTVLYEGEVIDRYRGALLGLAIDLGTTTVVVDLVDLETGRSLRRAAFENPQRFGGSDVMNRISYDAGPSHRFELQRAAAIEINRAIVAMTDALGLPRLTIYEVVIAANTTMRDLFFKLDVQSVGQRPYKSTVEHEWRAGKRATTALVKRAKTLGLRVNPKARAYGLPLIASHVGADTAADLLALDLTPEGEDTVLLVDMGTNTEVVLRHQGRMIAASCPAGPAFEGGLVKYGMPAYDGAIETIRLDPANDRFEYRTIGGKDPVGLCGSGLIDLLAELSRHGRMTPKGVFAPDRRQREVEVVPECGITLSREDASNLAQAKAANYCGQYIVLRHAGASPADVARLYLAGGFAHYVDVANAALIGLLAAVPEARVVKVGNAALKGARLALLSRAKRRALEATVACIEHIELETTPDFFEIFVEGCQFKPMPATLEHDPIRLLQPDR